MIQGKSTYLELSIIHIITKQPFAFGYPFCNATQFPFLFHCLRSEVKDPWPRLNGEKKTGIIMAQSEREKPQATFQSFRPYITCRSPSLFLPSGRCAGICVWEKSMSLKFLKANLFNNPFPSDLTFLLWGNQGQSTMEKL